MKILFLFGESLMSNVTGVLCNVMAYYLTFFWEKKVMKNVFYYSTECRYVFIHLFIFVYIFLWVLGSGLG